MSLQKSPLYAYFPAADVARARKFGEHTAAFLYPTPNAGTSQASQAFWQVADVGREVVALKARGVKFEDSPGTKDGILTAGGAKAAWFKDSEGNILALVQGV